MSRRKVKLGQRGEELAAGQLARQGYTVVTCNWRCQVGEIDIVARRGEIWTFFEVRTRRGRAFGTPEESLTPGKMRRMTEVAKMYLSAEGINVHHVDWRIGFVAVEMDEAGHLLRVDVYEELW